MSKAAKKLKRVAILCEAAVHPRRQVLGGVARYMREHGPWQIFLRPSGVERSLESWVRDWEGDGAIVAIWSEEVHALREMGLPIVDVVGVVQDRRVPLVHADDRAIGRMGADHLLTRGFQTFGFVEFEEPDAVWATNRRLAFIEAVQAAGFDAEVCSIPRPRGKLGPEVWEQQQAGLARWISKLRKPVGVMASHDLIAQQFLEACQRARVVVPEEVAVIGVDNDELICEIASPPLTSIVLNDHQRGYEAAAVLDRLMRGEPPPQEVVWIPPTGVVSRASTDIMAIDDAVVVQALQIIRDQASEGIDVGDVVTRVPCSRSVLERRFRNLMGRSINEELTRVRVNKAVELLSLSQLELKQIAAKAGFGSVSYMCTVFQRTLGRTPRSFRKAKLNGPVRLRRENKAVRVAS